jgi:peroxisomal membrane protein 4
MTFLFRNGTFLEKIKSILIATFTHAKNLAHFVVIYKSILYLFKWLGNEIKQYHTFVAAFVGGYYVFGKKNSINEQVSLSSFFFF